MNAGQMPNWATHQNSCKRLVYKKLRIAYTGLFSGQPRETGGSRAAGGGFQPLPQGAVSEDFLLAG
jgi:hypothetical protein